MKKILLFAIFILLSAPIAYYGCSQDNLDIKPATLTEVDYYTTEDDFYRGVVGVYSKLTDFYWFNNNNPLHGFWQLPGDDITTNSVNPFEVFTMQPGTGEVNTYYSVSYQLLNRANILLEKMGTEQGVYKTPNLKNHHKGEVLFLRGYTLFNLWNYYGTSPLVLERIELIETDKLTPPGTRGNELIDQAIKDLQEAASLLPATWDNNNRGRVTANAANGMLGKALLFRGTVGKSAADYTAALAALGKVTGRLVDNFEDNFDAAKENNEESLFEYQASQPNFDNPWLSNDFEQGGNGSTSTYWGYYENHWSLFGKTPFLASKKLVEAFDPADPRLAITADPATRAFKKYIVKDKKTQSGVASANNPRILRYADVLLMRAEALVQSNGGLADAIGLINQVRTRARAMKVGGTAPADYATTEADRAKVMDWIRKERLMELAGEEGNRWLDLRRWHIGGQINLSTWDFSSDRTEFKIDPTKHTLFPIPQGELDINPNMKQNSGY